MITDTYPNKARYRRILMNRATSEINILGEFSSNLNSEGLRCNFHPRFSTTGNEIFFDSASLERKLYRLNIGKFSVLISVYVNDNHNHFDRAIESIWFDQVLRPNEVILIVDGPVGTEITDTIVKWKKILGDILKIIRNESNQGLAVSLNTGLRHCSSELIMRMDADDISMPQRFRDQVKFMMTNPSVSVLSGNILLFDNEGAGLLRSLPRTNTEIRNYAKFRNPIHHPCVCFRKSVVMKFGGYPLFRTSQDYALWSRLLVEDVKFGNLPNVLLHMRGGSNLIKRRGFSYFRGELKILKFNMK